MQWITEFFQKKIPFKLAETFQITASDVTLEDQGCQPNVNEESYHMELATSYFWWTTSDWPPTTVNKLGIRYN